MQRYLQKHYNTFLDDDVITTPMTSHIRHDDVMDDDPFLVMVKEKVKVWSRALNDENQEHVHVSHFFSLF